MKASWGNVFPPKLGADKPFGERVVAVQATTTRVSVAVHIDRKPIFSQMALETASVVAASTALHPATRKNMLRLVALVDEFMQSPQKERYLAMIRDLVVVIETLAEQNKSKSYTPWSLEKAIAYMEDVLEQVNPQGYGDIQVQIDIEMTTLQLQISEGQNTVCCLV